MKTGLPFLLNTKAQSAKHTISTQKKMTTGGQKILQNDKFYALISLLCTKTIILQRRVRFDTQRGKVQSRFWLKKMKRIKFSFQNTWHWQSRLHSTLHKNAAPPMLNSYKIHICVRKKNPRQESSNCLPLCCSLQFYLLKNTTPGLPIAMWA